jgi:hypothetical protein
MPLKRDFRLFLLLCFLLLLKVMNAFSGDLVRKAVKAEGIGTESFR